MNAKKGLILAAVFFVATAFIIYSNVLNGEFVYDDFEYVVDNPMIRDFSHMFMSDPRQIGYLTFAVNYEIHDYDTFGYHLVNVAVHGINASLVFLLISQLAVVLRGKGPAEKRDMMIALLTGTIFLVHPLQTQAVAYITQRFTSLSTLFYLCAVVLYLKGRMALENDRNDHRGYLLYALSLASTVLAMRTKEISFTIPFMIALIELLLFRMSAFGKRRAVFLIPFGITLMVIPLALFGPDLGLISPGDGIVEATRQEKMFDLQERSAYEYLLTQFRVLFIYLRLMIMPIRQSVVYDLVASRSLFELPVLLSLTGLIALLGTGFFLWRYTLNRLQSWSVQARMVMIGIYWFFLTASVESSFIPIKDLIFEHRAYLPGIGIFLVLSVIVITVAERLGRTRKAAACAIAGLIICIPLAAATYARNDVWTSELKLWDDVVQKLPNKPIGYNNRGNAYAKLGQLDLALQDINRTVAFFPTAFTDMLGWEISDLHPANMSKTYLTRASIYAQLGDTRKAEEDMKRARDIFAALPGLGESSRRADLYSRRGAFRHAIQEYTKILEWDPENVDALNDRGNAYSKSDRFDEAIRDFDAALRIQPGFTLAYYNRGIAYAWSGRAEKAIEDFSVACTHGFQPACESIKIVKSGGK